MANNVFMETLRSFFGLRPEPPRNDFRNPIWGSDDDDDDGDELYTRQQLNVYSDPVDLHREIANQMHDMFKSFGSIFGDMKSFFNNDHFDSFVEITELPSEPETCDSNTIRAYYLKPGYHKTEQPKEDIDLDGQISSNEISGLLKKKDGYSMTPMTPFNGNLVPGRSYCQTIITTSVTKSDGTVETRRIVKNGNEVIEDSLIAQSPGLDTISTSIILSDLASLLRNFY